MRLSTCASYLMLAVTPHDSPVDVDFFEAVGGGTITAMGYCSTYSCAIVFITDVISTLNSFRASLSPRKQNRIKQS